MPTKVHLVKAMVFPVVMYRCESWHKEGWTPKNWCFQIVVLEKTLEGPLDFRETKPVNPKGNQSEYVSERLMLKLKLQYFGHQMWRAYLWEKTLMPKDWRQEEKGTTDEMVGWHHRFSGHEFEQAAGDDEGQGNLACCSPWGHKEPDTTERLNQWEDWLF